MASALSAVRAAFVALARRPGSTLVAILTLALGIGANSAIFSLLNAVVLRPLPVSQPDQLIALSTQIADNINGDQPFTLPMFDELTRQSRVFSQLFAWNDQALANFEANGRPRLASLAAVSGGYYQAMRITPLLGRFFTDGDVALHSGASPAIAVLSYRAWRGWYGGDSQIIGKVIRIENRPFTIVGVEPEGFTGMIVDGSTDVTIPLLAQAAAGANMDQFRSRNILWLHVFGRMRPGVSFAQAKADVLTVWPHILADTAPAGYEGQRLERFFARKIAIEPAARGNSFLRTRFSKPLQILLALVGAVLLIACLNLANLSLARAIARQHETGVRAALGASAWELARQPILESLLLSFCGAAIGLLLAYWISTTLLHIAWVGLTSVALSTAPDMRVFAFTAFVTLVAGLVFAVAPALQAIRIDPIIALRLQNRSVRGDAEWMRKSLLAAQFALSLILISGALLFARTVQQLHNADVGYDRDRILTMLLFPQAGKRSQNSSAYYQELARRLRELPGVTDVSFSNLGPANQVETFESVYRTPGDETVQAVNDFVAPDFFSVMGMRVESGREFTWADDGPEKQNVAMISRSLAERLFGKEDAIGRTVYTGPRAYAQKLRIVGVVNSASLWKVESVHPMAFYLPLLSKFPDIEPLTDIRTAGDPQQIKTAAERVVRDMGHQYSLRTMTARERLDSYIAVQRLTALLAGFFGAVAILIAAIGIYGLMSFYVNRRTAEFGIRLALGATRGRIVSSVLREVLGLALAGCAMGLAGSLVLAKLVRGILFGVSATDPWLLALATSLLVGVALAAGLAPAQRAARLDPMQALREE